MAVVLSELGVQVQESVSVDDWRERVRSGTQSRPELLVADLHSVQTALRGLDKGSWPKRILVLSFTDPPFAWEELSALPICGWMVMDGGSGLVEYAVRYASTCEHSPLRVNEAPSGRKRVRRTPAVEPTTTVNPRCSGCALRRSLLPPALELSRRELKVFERLSHGLGPNRIALELGISVKTIEAHRARIKQKLAVVTGVELSAAAINWRLGLYRLFERMRQKARNN